LALAAGLVLGLASCQNPPGSAIDVAPYVLTTSGGYVLSDAPAGIEVSLGSKLLRPKGAPETNSSSRRGRGRGGM
jgi:hypothetical protein